MVAVVVLAGALVGVAVGCGAAGSEAPSLAQIESGLARSVNRANPVETACVVDGEDGYTCVMGPFQLTTTVACDALRCTWEFSLPATPDSAPRLVTGSFPLQ